MRSKRFLKSGVLQLALVLSLFFSIVYSPLTAEAATEVDVGYGLCSIYFYTDEPVGYFGLAGSTLPPLLLKLPDNHRDMYITLGSAYSIAVTEDLSNMDLSIPYYVSAISYILGLATSELPPGMVSNVYSVRFLDANNNIVWEENGAIPNGGDREFFVGANVKYIAVRSWYNLGMLEYPRAIIQGGGVYYTNAYEIEEDGSDSNESVEVIPVETINNVSEDSVDVTYVSQYYWKSNYTKGWYEGEWNNGAPNGWGKLTYDDSENTYCYRVGENRALYYEGNFSDGTRYGYGTVVYENGYKDEGTFYGSWQEGKIVFVGKRWLTNEKYNGYWPITIIATNTSEAYSEYGEWQSVK